MSHAFRRLLPVGAAALALLVPSAAHATASAKQIKAAETAGVTYLKSQQLSSGAFEGFGGEWTPTGLAAAKVAAANVKQGGSGTDARTYYRSLFGNTATWPGEGAPVSAFSTAALSSYAAGIDPARVSASQNLIAQIIARQASGKSGYYGEPGFVNETIFALIALADTKTRSNVERVPASLLAPSVAVVRANQHTDGGWTYTKAEGSREALEAPAEAETTGAAMAALCGAGVSDTDPAIVAAKNFLVADLKAEASGDGAFAGEFGANTDTNAWAVQGLDACGIPAQGAEFTTSSGKTPIDFLISQQLAGGGFRYEPSGEEVNLYSTQDAERALAGAGFTAPPPTPSGAPKWVYEASFTNGVPALLTLVINSGTTHSCAVKLSSSTALTTLAKVLEAAETASTPAGCVTSLTPTTGTGSITSINGLPSPPEAKWDVSVDGAAEAVAKRSKQIHIGDTIYLHLT
jgi:hypothetical protein